MDHFRDRYDLNNGLWWEEMTTLLQRFCWTCGHVMAMKSRTVFYDVESGEPVTVTDYTCPRKRWYHLWRHPAEPPRPGEAF